MQLIPTGLLYTSLMAAHSDLALGWHLDDEIVPSSIASVVWDCTDECLLPPYSLPLTPLSLSLFDSGILNSLGVAKDFQRHLAS